MHRILVFSTDDIFTQRLESVNRAEYGFEMTVVDQVDRAVEVARDLSVDALIVDEAAREMHDQARTQLLEAADSSGAVYTVGELSFDQLDSEAHLGDRRDIDGLLARLARSLSARAGGPESGAYINGDGRGSGSLSRSGELARHTSAAQSAGGATPRLMYVGGDGPQRRRLETYVSEVDADIVAFDAPREVDLGPGGLPIDLAVVAVEQELTTTRQLVGWLRRHQPYAPFDVLLVADPAADVSTGVGRIFGAQGVIEPSFDPAKLVARARQRSCEDRARLIVVSPQARRVNVFASALAGEPLTVVFVPDGPDLEDAFDELTPDLVLIDGHCDELAVEPLVDTVRKAHPFACTQYLGVVDEPTAADRRGVDDVLATPLMPAELRRVIRLHLTYVVASRGRLDRDRLTGVQSTLGLGDDLQRRLDRAARAGDSVMLTAVDVDDLDVINGRYGRAVGDSVLRSLADALLLVARGQGVIYRTDADEFFVLHRLGGPDDGRAVRERIDSALHVFRQQTFRSADGRGTYATASAGAIVAPPSGVSAEFCLQKCWVVLQRACATRQDRLLVAQLDPAVLPEIRVSDDVT